jgi:segregation and condensation protein B
MAGKATRGRQAAAATEAILPYEGEAPAATVVHTEAQAVSADVPLDGPAVVAGEVQPEAPSESNACTLTEAAVLVPMIEAILFVAQGPVTADRLVSVFEDVSKADVREALRRLGDDYARSGRGVELVELAGGYQFVTRAEVAPWIARYHRVKPAPKLSRSALEALAIIAYKQPIVRSEIEQIRGVETSGVMRTLLERKLVRIVGRKEVPGRPILYGTTKVFLQHFGLRDLSELPPLREIKELGDAEQISLPVDDDLSTVGAAARTDGGGPSESALDEAIPRS